jgi:O-antigen ligase
MALERSRWLPAGLAILMATAVNVGIGLGAAVGQGPLSLTLAVGLLPALLIIFGAFVESHRALLAWAALGLQFTNLAIFIQPLPLPGGTRLFPTDVLLLLAVGAWFASRLTAKSKSPPTRLSPAFGWPLALLAVTVAAGIAVGHERYGASITNQALRLVLYAGIALAIIDVTADAAWRAITVVFYAGAVVQSLWAAYYLATGTSQTAADTLSTGGVRVLSLGVAIYLTGSLVCALLNLELDRRGTRQPLHLLIAGLASFGIVVSFGRTTYAAVVLIVPLILVTRRRVGKTVLLLVPLLLPLLAAAALAVPTAAPSLVPTVGARLSGTSTNDSAVEWRTRALDTALAGVRDEWLTGVGFGRRTEFEMNNQVIRIQGDPHNSYVWLLAGGGVLALGSFLLVCGTYVVDAVRRLRRAPPTAQALVTWSLATWLAFMINALTGPVLSDPLMMMSIWVLMALPGLVAIKRAR